MKKIRKEKPSKPEKTYLDEDGHPTRSGVYLIRDPDEWDKQIEIDVYHHPVKGFCCFADDFGSAGSGVNDAYDCHVSVQCTGLTFIKRLRGFHKKAG
jgi:hypothetical protein